LLILRHILAQAVDEIGECSGVSNGARLGEVHLRPSALGFSVLVFFGVFFKTYTAEPAGPENLY
jgi:hypothetical protein